MAQEAVPLSVAADDNLRIALVPTGSNALSVAILAAGTVKDLTYSFTPDGFNLTTTQDTVEDKRLTLKQNLSKRGRVTQALEVKYVHGDAADVAKVALAEGTTGKLVLRYSIANATAWTVAQKVDVITFEAGIQRKDAPAENGVQTMSQTLFITGVTLYDQALVA